MDSSEIVDSGMYYGARSSFSQTCNLLSQYLKENGSFGELTLGLTPASEKGAPTETMNLLSTIEKSGSRNRNPSPAVTSTGEEIQIKSEAGAAPMTIFYAGQVIVFNNIPAEKAKEIISLASKLSAAQSHPISAFTPPVAVQSPAESTTSVPIIVQPNFASIQRPLNSDLPIARKNSLARFLEKRRDRITANSPYTAASKESPAKAEEWLGLGPQRN